jgi:hypothetical protein
LGHLFPLTSKKKYEQKYVFAKTQQNTNRIMNQVDERENIDGWTLCDLTVIQHDFFPMYVNLVDSFLTENKNKQEAAKILSEQSLAFVDKILYKKTDDDTSQISQFSVWQHDYTPIMCDLIDNFLCDTELIAENPGRTKAEKKTRVREIIRFHLPLMIKKLVDDHVPEEESTTTEL